MSFTAASTANRQQRWESSAIIVSASTKMKKLSFSAAQALHLPGQLPQKRRTFGAFKGKWIVLKERRVV
jgi:hypothetical protein